LAEEGRKNTLYRDHYQEFPPQDSKHYLDYRSKSRIVWFFEIRIHFYILLRPESSDPPTRQFVRRHRTGDTVLVERSCGHSTLVMNGWNQLRIQPLFGGL
jgi:hypothetical protein